MSIMGTFDTMTAARLAIYAAQKGLSVTGNNIANINTEGYTRQNLDQVALKTGGSDRYQYEYAAKVGNGVLCTGVSQTRDIYLDIRYRTQMAYVGAMDTKVSGLNNVAEILDEVGDGENSGDGIVEAQLNDLFETLENLDVNAGHEDYDAQVRSSASNLCVLLNSYAKQLATVEENTVSQLNECVDEINSILSNIRDLNAQIRKSEIHGDAALEMRDDRNVLIDQLSEYMKINVTYEMEDIGGGQQVEKVVIRLGDANEDTDTNSDTALLVDGVYCTQLSLDTEYTDAEIQNIANSNNVYDPETEMYSVILSELTDSKGRAWSETTEISAAAFLIAQANNNAIGATSFDVDNGDGTITTYEEDAGVYTKTVKSQAYMLEDNDLYGSLQAYRELLTEAGEFSTDTMQANDPDATTKRGIPYYEKALDLLANQIATQFNRLNQAYQTDESGNYLDVDGDPIGYPDTDADGNAITSYLNITQTEDEIKDKLALAGKADTRALVGNTTNDDAGILFSNSGTGNDASGITAANISISDAWANGEVRIVNSFTETVAGMGIPSTASDNIDRFISAFSVKYDYYANADDTDPMFSGTFQEMLTNMSATLGNDIRISNVLLDTYDAAATELNTSRDSVSGVDLNDEAMNLMTYQRSYQAACRLMTTLDEVLDKLINGTAV